MWLIRAPRPGPIGLVVRVSLATGTVRARRIVAGANAIRIGSRALWVTVAFPKERLLRLDPSSLKVLADYPLL